MPQRRLSRWLVVLVGAVVAVAAVALLAPAAALDAPLAARTGERLRLTDARGFWWRGHGVLATADGRAHLPLAWTVDVGPLLRGTLSIRLSDPDTSVDAGTLSLRDGGVDLRNLHVRVPAAVAGAVDSRLAAIGLGGNVALDASALASRGGGLSGELEATWERARVAIGEALVDLGTITVVGAPAGDGMAGTIRNAGGDVAVSGTLAERGGVIDAAVALSPRPAASDSARNALLLLGAPDGSASVRFAWRSDR